MTLSTVPPREGEGARALDDLLLYRLSRLLGVAGSMVIRLCEGRFGITRREWRLIATLASRGALSSSQLAAHAQLDRARTSKAVGSMVAKQLVSRTQPGGDRRHVLLSLTPEGRALYDALYPLVTVINAELLAVLDDAHVKALDEALEALQRRAETLVAAAELPKADRRRGRG
ncbi:MarR family winged helix-turn-helix transcriptional regulator [Xenophilus sp. Marseille-Q4582]|uniref:MarR family winged helix-turn-helix transcriptional regulator n=1 Tax=Xenophilus sp. Marseille-Q4582 TaxID=2866600 RepID=UPI001CE3C6FA|nr:MarR family transcriptional regulator [Xenophilus sp. Marseille-Q4582]